MNDIYLGYGDSTFLLSFDPDHYEVLASRSPVPLSVEEHLIESPPLSECSLGKRVLVIVSDLTRPTGAREFLPSLMMEIDRASEICFLFATGLHRALVNEDKVGIVGESIFEQYRMLDHHPDKGNSYVGETSFGNRVEINSAVLEHDLVVLTGSIGFHYFAGFSGGRKSLLPGVASKQSINFNHLLVLNQNGSGRNPNVVVARMEGNPVHDDMVEAVKMIETELFLYNTILDSNKRVSKVFTGSWLEAHRRGTEDYLSNHSVTLTNKRQLVIASCGGFPRDINMIQAHKVLEFAQYAVNPGGTIILLAECREGAGHPGFYNWFRNMDLPEIEGKLRSNYEVYGQTAYSLLSKTKKFRVICVSELPERRVREMGMEPAKDLEAALSMLDTHTKSEPGYILPFGATILPLVEGQ